MPPAKNNIAAKAARIEARKSRPGSNRDVNRQVKARIRDIDKYMYKGRTRHVHNNSMKRHAERKAAKAHTDALNAHNASIMKKKKKDGYYEDGVYHPAQ